MTLTDITALIVFLAIAGGIAVSLAKAITCIIKGRND